MQNNFIKTLIVAAVIIAVVAVIILKNQPASSEKEAEKSSGVETVDVPLLETKDLILSEKTATKPAEESAKSTETEKAAEQTKTEIPAETQKTLKPKKKQAEGNVLALVNGEEITKSNLEENFKTLPPQYKDMFKNDKDSYLDQLVIKELLLQKAVEKGYLQAAEKNPAQQDAGIQQMIAELGQNIEIPDSELEQFYQENKGQMQGAAYDQVKNDIHSYLAQQKQGELIEIYIEELKNLADIVLNQKWIEEQIAARPENPLTKVLGKGLPTVLDLGADNCIPCKMMKPIFAELEKELDGIANILLLEIADYRDIANEYKVRVIPTQIFFDQNGEQYWRHEGFLSKEDILKKLRETGVEL